MLRAAILAAALLAPVAASADDRTAPGGQATPVGVSGAYRCAVGPSANVAFRFRAFEDGQYRIDQSSADGLNVGYARYPWQLATATLFRERVSRVNAAKFRRISGSLRTLHELVAGQTIRAEYKETPLDGRTQPIEWRYAITVGQRAATFGPSGLGEIEIVQIEERRQRYVDAQGAPLTLREGGQGFVREEVARIAYAPSLGLALRIERAADGRTLESCALDRYSAG